MAFPVVSSIEEFEFGSSDPIVLASAPAAGELIVLCLMTRNGTGAHTAVGYTAIANTTRMSTLYRINNGTESASIDVTWSEENNRVAYAVRVSGHHSSQAPEGVSAFDNGGNVASIAAPTVTPSWGSADTLWVAFAGAQGGNTGVTYPLPDNQDVHVEPGVSVTAAMCSDGVTTGSLSPGTWQFNPTWFRVSAITVAIRPAGAATVVTPADASHAHIADQPTLTQTHELATDAAAHTHTADQPVLTQVHEIAADSALHAHTADNPALAQVHVLAADDATHGHIAEQPALTSGVTLIADPAIHTHTAESPTLTQTHLLVVDDAAHAHLAEQAALTQLHELLVDDAAHAHTADNVTLTQIGPVTFGVATLAAAMKPLATAGTSRTPSATTAISTGPTATGG